MSDSAPSERRSLVRFPSEEGWHILLRVGVMEPAIAAVRDLTVQGAGLVVDQPLAPGTALLLRGTNQNHDPAAGLPAVVCHSRPLPDGGWFLGCRFGRLLTVDDLDALR